jgi:hypothetical protein
MYEAYIVAAPQLCCVSDIPLQNRGARGSAVVKWSDMYALWYKVHSLTNGDHTRHIKIELYQNKLLQSLALPHTTLYLWAGET